MKKIYLVITNPKNGLSKIVDVTDYSAYEFEHTVTIYSKNFDVQVKRTTRVLSNSDIRDIRDILIKQFQKRAVENTSFNIKERIEKWLIWKWLVRKRLKRLLKVR